MRGRQSRRDIENANFKRQAEALTVLTIGTVILGGALFQVDVSNNNLLPRVTCSPEYRLH